MAAFPFNNIFFFSSATLLLCILATCTAVDTITANQTIRDGDTIVSAGDSFEMGFFSPDSSTTRRYFGIWYKKQATGTVVWVANREIPVTSTLGLLTLSPDGVLGIQNASNSVIWSSNSSGTVQNPVAQLLDTGNLVVRDGNDENPYNFIWQSFDFPVDTLLPGQKFGRDLVKGINRHFVQWKTDVDPSPGNVSAWVDTIGYPQMVVRKGSDIVFRHGSWNGVFFSGEPSARSNPIYTFGFVLNDKEMYYQFQLTNKSVVTRLFLSPLGDRQQLLWIDRSQEWVVYWTAPSDRCDRYGLCGVHGSCESNNSPCGCLEGFEPKFPDTQHTWYNLSLNLEECQQLCKKNCSCTAYANADIRGSGSGCILWFSDREVNVSLLFDTNSIKISGDLHIKLSSDSPISKYVSMENLALTKTLEWKVTLGISDLGIVN